MTSWLTVCVYLPHLMIEAARLRHPPARPLAVAAAASDRAPILDRDMRAAASGVEIGMPVLTARRLCRDLLVMTPDRSAIADASREVTAILAQQTDNVHRTSANLWIARAVALGSGYRAAAPLAQAMRAAITTSTSVHCQVGLARTAIVATIAARTARSVQVILPDSETSFLAPLHAGILPGVGAKTLEALAGLGVTTVGQLQMLSADTLVQICGYRGRSIARLAVGQDAVASSASPTITARWVADEPEADLHRLRARVHALTAEAGRELRSREQAAGEVSLRVVWMDGGHSQRIERDPARRTLDASLGVLSKRALDALLHERRLAIRAITLTLADFGARQIDLFAAADDRPHQLQHALDRLALRYGPQIVVPGSLVGLFPAAV